jgi:hypothetical protein
LRRSAEPAQRTAAGREGATDDFFERIQARATELISRRINYTGVETIERRLRHDGCTGCESFSRLRLEVAVIGGTERFAWPGAKEFEDRELADLIETGMAGSGDFAGVSDAVVLSNLTQYRRSGDANRGGRRTIR